MKRDIFTSTGAKILHHPEALRRFKREQTGTPISLQVAPTSKCNLNCVFCSNVNREKHESLDQLRLTEALKTYHAFGLKTVEWTGGGDPTLYEHIIFMLMFCDQLGLEQGFITNGVALWDSYRDNPDAFGKLRWLRISMNFIDYDREIKIPFLPYRTTLGFSYVMNSRTTKESIQKLHEYVKEYKPSYVRIVPDCQVSDEEQKKNNLMYLQVVRKWGNPYFYQVKEFRKPSKCFWCYFKPFLLHDEFVYPCSSVVLNDEADRQFHSKYRWHHMSEIRKIYQSPIKEFSSSNCSHCVFCNQNNLLIPLADGIEMENFV